MRGLLLSCLLTASTFAQTGKFGAFTNSDDVGAPPIKGSAEFDASTGKYRITGSGTDIWGKADQFHYVWREMSGNFAVMATAQFLTEGNDHRKAVIMLRQSLDTDSPFVHAVIHGNGMPGVQFRNTKGGNTNTVDFPIEGPGTFKLKLTRQGTAVTIWIAKNGAALAQLGQTESQLGSPVLVGLGVSSHTQAAVNTVLFSDVSLEQLAPAPAARTATGEAASFGAFTNSADVGDPSRKGSAQFNPSTGQYRITGAGANIWAQQDQFQYVWREMSGNFAVTATMEFLGQGEPHRKAGIMLRQSLDTDSVYGDLVIHGNGMPGIQWRGHKGERTNTFNLPFDGPGKFKLKLVRNGVRLFVFLAKGGAELSEVAHTEVTFWNPILAGLAVCAHNAETLDTAIFSDVSVEPLPQAAGGN